MTKMNETEALKTNRTYKSRMFEMIFSNKKELLELYNAMNRTHYEDPELLEINTLKNAIYMSMHNDISFIIDSRLALYEHQSTYSPNLPLRFLLYIADLYSAITKDENLYGMKAVKLPTPKFVVFYNGEQELPDIQELKLSDVFIIPEDHPALDLKIVMVNINPGHNEPLLNACKTLKEYTEYTARVRAYAKLLPLNEAVETAITECIQEGILSDFLSKNRAEAKKMSIYEYDEERHMRQTRDEGREEGLEAGLKEGIRALIEAYQEFGYPQNKIIRKLIEKFQLTEEAAQKYISDFLPKNRAKAKKMSIYEYDEERHMRQTREEGREEGLEDGRKEGRKEGIRALVESFRELGISQDSVLGKLIEKFRLSEETAREYMNEYWK